MDKYPKYISQEQQELFEKYLMEEMPVEEQLSFKARLADDENLQKVFEEFKALFDTVEEAGLREKMQEFHKTFESNNIKDQSPERLFPFKFSYRIAASIAILFALGSFWFFNKPSSHENLYNKYYTQDPGLPTVMGSNDNYDFFEAMVDYKQGNYDVAISKWEKLLANKPENDTLNYFIGVSLLAIGDYEQSITHLQMSTKSKESIFKNEMYLFLGMAYLKGGNTVLAKKYFVLSNHEKANELLVELDK